MKTVLITGSGGRMGPCIAEELRRAGYNVVTTSRRPDPERGIVALDIKDRDACMKAMAGVDTVIDLAYYMKNDNFREAQVPTNIIGTWNLYEAAVKNGVRRFIFCSTNHVVGFYKHTDKLRDDIMPRPDSPYAVTKCFSELCGRYFSDRCGISVINVRIGAFIQDGNGGIPYSKHRCRIWLSYRDTQQLFRKCVEADDSVRFLTVYGVSANGDAIYDVSKLKETIGYEPQDNGMDYLEEAEKINRFNGLDDNIFLGGDNPLRDPWTGEYVPEDLEELTRRHGGN